MPRHEKNMSRAKNDPKIPVYGFCAGASRRLSARIAGLFSTAPEGSKREPWQGQSQLRSSGFQVSKQPRCVQRGSTSISRP